MRKLCVIIALAVGAPGTALAETIPPLPPTATDISAARSLSIAASRGLAGGNEGVFLNSASLAARRRYSMELQWSLDRVGSENRSQFLGFSVVDSQTSSVTGGFGYVRMMNGPTTGDVFGTALAARVTSHLFVGATGRYLRLSGQDPGNLFTADASMFYATSMFSFGVSGYNLIPVGNDQQAPRGVGTGIAIGNELSYNVTADYRIDFDRRGKQTDAYAFGAEYLAFGNFPFRGGFVHDDIRSGRWWTAGAGFVSASGFALDLAYQQSLDMPSARVLAAALKLSLMGPQ